MPPASPRRVTRGGAGRNGFETSWLLKAARHAVDPDSRASLAVFLLFSEFFYQRLSEQLHGRNGAERPSV
jgi:hypothetical protein